jgi:type IV secretory pathway VirB10-like protein
MRYIISAAIFFLCVALAGIAYKLQMPEGVDPAMNTQSVPAQAKAKVAPALPMPAERQEEKEKAEVEKEKEKAPDQTPLPLPPPSESKAVQSEAPPPLTTDSASRSQPTDGKVAAMQRQWLAEGLQAADRLKPAVVEYFLMAGEFPSSNDDIGLGSPAEMRTARIASVTVMSGGKIKVLFRDFIGSPAAWMRMAPTSLGGPVVWRCETNAPAVSKFLTDCKMVQQ